MKPSSLTRWLTTGNWPAKLGALLLTIGSGALVRYVMLHVHVSPARKILSGIALAALLAGAGAALARTPARRTVSLVLTGAALAVAYFTAYSAYAFFHFVVDAQALGLLFMVATFATAIAIVRRSLSIAVLAMTGAYSAPAFALQGGDPLPVFGYYVLVSLVTAIMVKTRGWRPLIHLSFLFTLAGALFIGWTREYYSPEYYPQMQPLLLILTAIHLVLPFLEPAPPVAERDWGYRFDRAYFVALPAVASVLTLTLAPRVEHEGAWGLCALALLWIVAAVIEKLRGATRSTGYLAVSMILLIVAGLLAGTRDPFLISSVILCLALAAAPWLPLSRPAETLTIGAALATASAYIVQSLFVAVSGMTLLNLPFGEHLLLGLALLAAAWTLHRRERQLAPIFALLGGTWLVVTLARELLRLDFDAFAQIGYIAALSFTGLAIAAVWRRSFNPWLAATLCGVGLVASGFASAPRFAPQHLLLLTLLGQILYASLGVACDRSADRTDSAGGLVRTALPLMLLPWSVPLSTYLHGTGETMPTLLVSCAFVASLLAPRRESGEWPNRLAPIGFGVFGIVLLYETLGHIERNAWAVAFDLICLGYLVHSAYQLSQRRHPDAARYGYLAVAAVACVSAAMVLRLLGPPGTLTVLALDQMLLPAVVSLLWAAIGALLTWVSLRRHSRLVWSMGSLLLVAAAVKLVLFDFGSLGQLANILAMMAAGGVFLLVAWIAPFPPKAVAQGVSTASR